VALRIKSHWHNDSTEKSLGDIAGAIAFIAWKIAKDRAINLHGEDFVYESDQQRMDVICEYLIFQVQLTDRLAHSILDDPDREELVVTLGKLLADYIQDNAESLFGRGDYSSGFIKRLNRRSTEYAEFRFTEEGPSYPFLRHLGFEIQSIMGKEGENRWVIDQVMDQDGPQVYRQLSRAVRDLFE
jgi:hypothetical protein